MILFKWSLIWGERKSEWKLVIQISFYQEVKAKLKKDLLIFASRVWERKIKGVKGP